MNEVQQYTVCLEEQGQRLDNCLCRIIKGVPKSHIYQIIRSGQVRINKKRAKPCARLTAGDIIRIPPLRQASARSVTVTDPVKARLEQSVLFEDQQLLVINKPAGIAVHGGSGLSLGLIEAWRKIRPDIPYLELAHRLDKETSGCLIMVKKRSVLRAIHALFETKEISKTYWAILAGRWQGRRDQTVDTALKKSHCASGERFVTIHAEGKASETAFKLLENFSEACFVEATPKTGRTHQIRVHAASLGHPVEGDTKYGGITDAGAKRIKRLYLHAQSVRFTLAGERHYYEAAIDQHFTNRLTQLRDKHE